MSEGWKDCVIEGLHNYVTDGLYDGRVGKGWMEGRKEGREKKEGGKERLKEGRKK